MTGRLILLCGLAGAGKTTVAKMVLGLEKMTGGEIYIAGKSMSSVSPKDIARRVQPVFQDPYSSLNPRMTVFDILREPLVVHQLGNLDYQREMASELMRLVQFSDSRRLAMIRPIEMKINNLQSGQTSLSQR